MKKTKIFDDVVRLFKDSQFDFDGLLKELHSCKDWDGTDAYAKSCLNDRIRRGTIVSLKDDLYQGNYGFKEAKSKNQASTNESFYDDLEKVRRKHASNKDLSMEEIEADLKDRFKRAVEAYKKYASVQSKDDLLEENLFENSINRVSREFAIGTDKVRELLKEEATKMDDANTTPEKELKRIEDIRKELEIDLMSQKTEIIELLRKEPMTQTELAFAIYNDYNHTIAIHTALKKLMESGYIVRTDIRPYIYSITGFDVSISEKVKKESKIKKSKQSIDVLITNEIIEEAHQRVMKTENYGKENDLITDAFRKFPFNTELAVVPMKIGLIDITNSTNISRYKSKISAVELAECIISIKDIDERIKAGDPEVVNEIAKSNGKINLFSFASKYCCYHNKNVYEKDDYSILDTILKDSLPQYFDDITTGEIKKWQNSFNYKEYNNFITRKLDELGITLEFRKRKFDHFVWFNNR